MPQPLLFVLFGPGGAGKGTVASRLVGLDPSLWLSRSWTTRQRRPGEAADAYEFVDRATFEERVDDGGFFEWAEFLGNLYGTPVPRPPDGSDVLLEIDLQGARQVRAARPDATLVLLEAPSPAIQAARLRGRGDDEDHVRQRVETGLAEVAEGRTLADEIVVNDDLDRCVEAVAGIVDRYRRARASGAPPDKGS